MSSVTGNPIYRKVYTKLWEDGWFESLNNEEKVLYICFLTNPLSHQCGIYELTLKKMRYYTGFDNDTLHKLLQNFMDKGKILYDFTTDEIAILNWKKYNSMKSEKIVTCVKNGLLSVKNKNFCRIMYPEFESSPAQEIASESAEVAPEAPVPENPITDIIAEEMPPELTPPPPEAKPIRNTGKKTGVVIEVPYQEIIDYLNLKTKKNYKVTDPVRKLINGRWDSKYTLEDFKTVIDNKVYEWIGTERAVFLRPQTLFAVGHFDEYLNQGKVIKGKQLGFHSGAYDKFTDDDFFTCLDCGHSRKNCTCVKPDI